MTKPKTKMIPLADITVPENRMRQLRPEKVDEIAESIAAHGLFQAIIVRPKKGKATFCTLAVTASKRRASWGIRRSNAGSWKG
jgi:hypothetical protein